MYVDSFPEEVAEGAQPESWVDALGSGVSLWIPDISDCDALSCRCIRRAEKCEYRLGELSGHGEARGGAQGEVPPSIIRQTIIDPPALFKAQAELLAAAVKQLHRDGGISRIRAINTL